MKPNILLITPLALMLFTTACIKNEYHTVTPTEPPPPAYNYVFDENFNNNLNNWVFSDPSNGAYVSIVNGWLKYTYLPLEEGTNTVAINTGAKVHRNFLVQTRIKSDRAMGVCFGVSDYDYGYSFFIDAEGYFAVFREGSADEGVKTLMDWQASSAIRQYDWNDVEFEQSGNSWMGYVNGTKVFELPAKNLNGSKIGYIVLDGTVGYSDYLTVQW